MTNFSPLATPVAIDRVDRLRGDGDDLRLRLSGRWLGPGNPAELDPLLVVTVDARRHRFPARREADPADPASAGRWEATFDLPAWAEPTRPGQAALWVGDAGVAVPPPGAAPAPPHHPRLPAPPALGEASPWPPGAAAPAEPATAGSPEPVVDTGRTGPLAELLFKESVTALHGELEQRAAEVARLRGQLADARAELESRTAKQASLETAHAELRAQLQELMAAATGQRQDFDRRVAELQTRVSEAEDRRAEADRGRAAAEAERDRARDELEHARSGTEEQLAVAIAERDAQAARVAELGERLKWSGTAEQHHASEVTSLREQLAAATVAREAAAGEVAGLQAELQRLGSELAVTREQLEARGGDLGEAQRLLADARALTEQMRGETSH
jgi:peptidoglycan hydrolase CwlO-like protein